MRTALDICSGGGGEALGLELAGFTLGHIVEKSKGGVDTPDNLRAICNNCNEGLQNAAPPLPDRIHLLALVRRATIDDQRAILAWLKQKFGDGNT